MPNRQIKLDPPKLNDDQLVISALTQTNIRQQNMILGIVFGAAWHPDCTAMEIEQWGSDLRKVIDKHMESLRSK